MVNLLKNKQFTAFDKKNQFFLIYITKSSQIKKKTKIATFQSILTTNLSIKIHK